MRYYLYCYSGLHTYYVGEVTQINGFFKLRLVNSMDEALSFQSVGDAKTVLKYAMADTEGTIEEDKYKIKEVLNYKE